MELAGDQVETSVLRRMLFSTAFLPLDLPHRWDLIASFASRGSSSCRSVSPESARIAMDNMQALDTEAFRSDVDVTKELIAMEYGSKVKQPVGIPLVPKQTNCHSCGGKLLLRSDRPCRLTL